MAASRIPPSSNPYAVGAVVFDSTPYTNYFLRQEAETKAREEALNKYFQDMDATISPTGMDVESDFPALEAMRENWRKYGLENKELINSKRDGGKAYVQFMRMFGDMKGYIEQSKQKVGQIQEYNKFRMNNPDSIIDEEFIANVDRTRQPIKKVVSMMLGNQVGRVVVDNQDWKPIDFTEFEAVKPLSPNELIATRKSYSANIKPSLNIESTRKSERDPLSDIITTVSAFDPEQLKTIGSVAGGDYDANKRLRVTVRGAKPSPEEMQMLTAGFQSVYGPEAKIDTPKDLYVAQAILDHVGQQSTEKEVVNNTRKQQQEEAQQMRLASYKSSLDRQEAAYKESLKQGTENTWLEKQIQNLENDPLEVLSTKKPSGESFNVKVIKVHTPVKKMFSVDGIEPDIIVQLPNGDFQGRFYKREDNKIKLQNGRKVISEDFVPVTLNRQQFKAAYGDVLASGSQLTNQLQQGQPQPQVQTNTDWRNRAKRVKTN